MRITMRWGLALVAATTTVVAAAFPGVALADAPGYSVTHVGGLAGYSSAAEAFAVSPDGRTAYVGGGTNHLAVLDVGSRRAVASIFDPAGSTSAPVGAAYNASGSAVYIAAVDGTVTVVNTATRSIVGRIGTPNASAFATGIAVRGNLAFVPEHGLGLLAVIDLAAKRVVRTVNIGTGRAAGVVIAANGSAGFVWGSVGVARVDLTSWAVSSVSTVWTTSAVVAANGATVYASQLNTVAAIAVGTGTVTHSTSVTPQSTLVLSSDGRYLYYGAGGQYDAQLHDFADDAMYRVDTTSWTVDEFDVPHDASLGPDKLNAGATTGTAAITPDGKTVLFGDQVVNQGGAVSVFRTDPTVTFAGWVSALGYLGAAAGPVAALPASGSVAYLPTAGGSDPYKGVDILDTATNVVTGMIPVPYGATSLAVSRDGHKLLTANNAGLSVVDPVARVVVKTMSVAGVTGPIVFAPNGLRAYVANSGSAVSVLDTSGSLANVSVINTVTLPVTPTGLAVSPDSKYLYAVGNTKVMKVTLATGAVRSVDLATSTGPAVAISPSGSTIYVTTSGGKYGRAVVALSAAGPTVTSSVSFGTNAQPFAVVGSPDGRVYATVYVGGSATVSLAQVDLVEHTWRSVVSSAWVAGQPVITPNGRTLYGYSSYDTRYANSLVVVRLAAHLTPTSKPTIAGTAQVGHTLTAKPGAWGPAPVTLRYQWLASGHAIAGATHATLKLAAAQAGKTITVRVTGSKTGYDTVVRTSAKSTTVAKGTLIVHTPVISGTARVGHTLTAKPGTWGPAPVTLRYQWFAAGHAIAGATHGTLKLTSVRVGKKLTVRLTGSKTGYTTVARTSKASAAVVR